jgi:hypothetical protein
MNLELKLSSKSKYSSISNWVQRVGSDSLNMVIRDYSTWIIILFITCITSILPILESTPNSLHPDLFQQCTPVRGMVNMTHSTD